MSFGNVGKCAASRSSLRNGVFLLMVADCFWMVCGCAFGCCGIAKVYEILRFHRWSLQFFRWDVDVDLRSVVVRCVQKGFANNIPLFLLMVACGF